MSQTVPQPSSPPSKLTYEEFLEWANEDTHAEWVDGEIVYMSPISDKHQDVGGFLIILIRYFVDEKRIGVVRYEPLQMKIGPDLPGRSPDILFVSTQNLYRLRENYLEGPADLVVEIISPESRSRDRGKKFSEYEQGGVLEYWLIDPIRKQAEFYQRGEDGRYHLTTIGEDGIYRSVVLEGFWLKVSWLWEEPLPRPSYVFKEWGDIG